MQQPQQQQQKSSCLVLGNLSSAQFVCLLFALPVCNLSVEVREQVRGGPLQAIAGLITELHF